jgi:hypothetical protein
MVDKNGQPLVQDLFFVQLDFTTGNANQLTVAGTATATRVLPLVIDTDAHFLMVGASRVATDVATDAVSIAFCHVGVSLKMTSSGRDLMNTTQHIENIAGTAQLPAAWPRPKFIAAGSALRATLTNLSTTTPYNVRLSFFGFKIFVS